MTEEIEDFRTSPLGNRIRMPLQKPGKSVQVVETPWEFIDAVEKRFRHLTFDLAATAENCKVRFPSRGTTKRASFFGPGSARGEDALKEDWGRLDSLWRGNLWLNPEFGEIKNGWAEKCAGFKNGRLFFLVPAASGTNWWSSFVHKKALVHFLSPRIKFVGHATSFPKDLALCIYGRVTPGYYCWRWDRDVLT